MYGTADLEKNRDRSVSHAPSPPSFPLLLLICPHCHIQSLSDHGVYKWNMLQAAWRCLKTSAVTGLKCERIISPEVWFLWHQEQNKLITCHNTAVTIYTLKHNISSKQSKTHKRFIVNLPWCGAYIFHVVLCEGASELILISSVHCNSTSKHKYTNTLTAECHVMACWGWDGAVRRTLWVFLSASH